MNKKKIWLPIVILHFVLISSGQMMVSVEGDASFDNSQYSVMEAGNDFPPSIQTESSIYVSIGFYNFWYRWFYPNAKWRIYVHKSDVNWNSDLALEAKRTGRGYKPWGNGQPNVKDGGSYQTVTNTPTYFFRGKSEVFYIPVQLQLSGVSVTMGAQDLETTIVFTVYGDW